MHVSRRRARHSPGLLALRILAMRRERYTAGVIVALISLLLATVATSTISPATESAQPVETFILDGSPLPGQRCERQDGAASTISFKHILADGLPQDDNGQPTFVLHFTAVSTSYPADPLGQVGDEVKTDGQSRKVVIAYLCNSGDVHTATINGYVVHKQPLLSGKGVTVAYDSGKAVQGTFDALRSADLSNLFNSAKYDGVGFLPVTGDNADTINAQLERNLPFLTPITDVKPIGKLCSATGLHLLIAGQGSLATQNLDGFRTLVTSASLFTFSQPEPWGALWKLGGAGFAIAAIPNTQGIPVQVFDCSDPFSLMAYGSLQVFADRYHPIPVIVGHSSQLAWGTNNRVQRRVLDLAISDLQNQLDCIVRNVMLAKGTPIPKDDANANSAWCARYYLTLPKDNKITSTPQTPMLKAVGPDFVTIPSPSPSQTTRP
jgi:hypothetical protein